MNADSVASVLVRQEIYGGMKKFILARSLTNANSVVSVSVKGES